ncbi:MAG: helix-turn-helix domain-containing protein [Acidimicrobiales bacterium]
MTSVTSPPGDMGDMKARRPLRADARRNVDKVLRAAEEVFATEGLAVPIDEIARRAGVGVGTVYRHFPTKQTLFHAVVMVRLEALVERAKELSRAADPGAAMFTFVSELVDLAVQKRDLADEMAQEGLEDEVHAAVKDELQGAFSVLLQRAQEAGTVRPDICPGDVTALLMGTCLAADRHAGREATSRLVGVICDGMRAQPHR